MNGQAAVQGDVMTGAAPVLSIYRPSFDLMPVVRHLPQGLTLAEMVAAMADLPADFATRGVVCVNGQPVPRGLWHLVRPRAVAASGAPVEVTFHLPPLGGGGDNGGKQVFALIASIALTAGIGAILGGKLATAGGLFKAGSLSASLLASGVGLAGSLILGGLSAPPIADPARSRSRPNEGAASATGNVLEPNGAIPRVVGTRKVFPPLAVQPMVYFDRADEVVEALFCLAGPHKLEDIRVGSAPITSLPGVEFETREGFAGDLPLEIVTRQSVTQDVQSELTGHQVDETSGALLDVFTDTALAVPQPQVVTTGQSPEQVLLHIAFPSGLHYQGDEAQKLRVPLRLRMREKGAVDWINLPELHFMAANIRQMRATIRLDFSADTVTAAAASAEGFVEARHTVPAQSDAPAGGGWVADASFIAASGDAWLASGNTVTTGVQNVELGRYEARIVLNPASFPAGRYEIEVVRGCAVLNSAYVASAYTVGGSVWNLFGFKYPASPTIARSRDGTSDVLYLLRCVSLWNAPPVVGGDLALIAVRARNIALDALSVVASGYVQDWNGTTWGDWVTTSNPAPHLRDVLRGRLNAQAVPEALVLNDELVAWRTACAANGWTCDHICEDQSVADVARVLTSCGYASLRQSEVFGVVQDYDRSAESPVQVFTPLNSANFQWSRGLPDLPDGFRVTFPDGSDDYTPRQIDVGRDASVETLLLPEMVSYEGFVDEAKVTARARFDLAQAEARGTFYTLDAPAEAIICRRGDLVAVSHDSLTEWMAQARITAVTVTGGDVVGLTLDCAVPVANESEVFSVTDIFAVADVFALGRQSAVMVRGANGVTQAARISGSSGSRAVISLTDVLDPADVAVGDLAVVGLQGQEVLRLVVFDIQPREDLTATLTLVDEGQELFAA